MKKIFIILALAFSFSAFSQNLLINTIEGGCQVIKTTNNDTAYYSNSVGGFARVRQSGKTYLYTKLGGQIASVELYSSIAINDSVYPTIPDFIDAINALPFFSTTEGGTLWTTSGGYYAPSEVKPFRFTSGSFSLLNDSLDLGFAKLPFAGVQGSAIDSLVGLNGFLDASLFGGNDILISGWSSFGGDKENAIYVFDTSGIQMISNNSSLGLYPEGFDVSQYNDTTQSQISIQQNGAINLRFDDYNKFVDYNISMGTYGMYLNYNDNNIGLNQNFYNDENGIGVYYNKQDTVSTAFFNKYGVTLRYLDSFDIQVNNSGLVLPRVTNTTGFTTGSIYYDTDDEEFKAMTQFTKRTISLYYEGFGNPTGLVTPDQAGVLYHDQNTNHIYISFGTTSADWIKLN